jgi:anthranilate synthase/aminodeoxychorismate synthase-like glutamine amidotransferase
VLFLLDNYDSFTYNLAQYLGELGEKVVVRRNDQVTLAEIERMKPQRIVISPGPGTPDTAGITLELIQRFADRVPLLGVCLGHQAIGQAFGGKVVRAPTLMHGKTSRILHDGRGVFRSLPPRFEAARYHSLMVSPKGFPRKNFCSHAGGRHHGPAPPALPHRGCAVPPRVDTDGRGKAAPEELPITKIRKWTPTELLPGRRLRFS